MPQPKYLLEGLPELEVEYGVYDGIDAAVEVSKPRGQVKGRRSWLPAEVKLDADGVEDIAGEEGNPADKEAS